jgi:eukaryotic-like serine/threonine-protein kinase
MRGTHIDDRYAVHDTLGEGGMAQVYLARDSVLDRDVALKVLRGQYAGDEEFVERFRREARNAAALNHPSIVQVYDQGQAEDGTYYMAMEYVPGGTLKDRIVEGGALDPGDAAGIAARVAEVLDVAHGRGIVHRDIKPQNVLLRTSGEVKVADFGIARAASSKTITETNLVLGTSAYMSPEQVSGDPAVPASDLYSLGVVLYEMLTGEQPYRADDPIATAMKHLDEPPRHPREANPAVPEELDALVVKLLAKKPEDRYASAAELAVDLGRVRDGLLPLAAGVAAGTTAPLDAAPGRTNTAPTIAAPGAARRRRRLLPLIAAVLVGVALLGGIAWALTQGPPDRNASEAGGAGRVEVPNVVGLTPEEAQQRLEQAGLEFGSQDQAPSDQVEAGAVVEQDPAAGTNVERGTAVGLVISTGPVQEPTVSASPSATPSASPTASPSASPSASPAGSEEAQKATEKAQKEAEKAAEKRQKKREEAAKRAQEALVGAEED